MKIVNIIGGLGNQMFQYAMFLALQNAHPEEELLLCRRGFKGYPLHNGYELDRIFGVVEKEASIWQLTKLAYPFVNYKSWQLMCHFFKRRKSMASGTEKIAFNYNEVTRNDSVFYDGYWQNDGNFKAIRYDILKAFTFPNLLDDKNLELAELLKNKRAVSCHVRRGDYLKDSIMCVCTSSYYACAIKEINEQAEPEVYCIFSDDIEWCKENLKEQIGDRDVVFVDWNKGENSYRDMQLMTMCHYNIIANSSFSWWGAWLNNHVDRIVVAPNKWMNKTLVNDPICEDWIRIKS